MQIKSPQVYITEASAGSGKTYALAKRYLKLIINPKLRSSEIPFQNILAITFTNKAAIEMKERILKFLKEIAFSRFKNEKEEKEILAYLEVDREYAAKEAFKLMDAIIKNYNFFQVQTIDSFINAILSGCAFKLNLSAAFKIKSDYSEYILYALDRLIDRAVADEEIMAVFRDYLKQYLFLENKTGWSPKKDILAMVSALFDDSNVYGLEFKKFDLKEKDDLFKRRGKIIQLVGELLDNQPEGGHQTVFKGIRNKFKNYADSFDIEELSRSFINAQIPLKKNYSTSPKQEKIWKGIRKAIGELFELEALALFNCYIDIFNLAYQDLILAASRDDVVFLSELNRKARILFDEQGITAPELYYRLAGRLRHYLIDEFQDTSFLQWKNLFLMVEEALSTGGTLFYVGDRKQAIFRFRGGDASLFNKVKEGFKAFATSHEYLKDNYRSQKEIVEFNNQVFSKTNLKRFLLEKQTLDKDKDLGLGERDIEDLLGVFGNAEQLINPAAGAGYLKIEKIPSETRDESNEIVRQKLVKLIRELKNRFRNFGNIALLCRTNRDIEEITSWLIEEKIPVESEKTLNIQEHPLIKEIVSFLKFLDSPIDNLSFASFILGDGFLKAAGLEKSEIGDFLFQIRKKGGQITPRPYLYREFRIKYPALWDGLIAEFFKNVGLVPLYELAVSILSKFKIPQRFPQCQGFIMHFLELIKRKVSEDNANLSSFLEFFDRAPKEELYLKVAKIDAVRIMSIHKAKGLGFPVVIIPFLEINVGVSSGRQNKPYVLYSQEKDLRLLKLGKNYLPFSDFLARIYRSEYKENLVDELNNVYVAFTRAENELYAFIPKKSANAFNLANLLIPEELFERGSVRDLRLKETKTQGKMLLAASEYKDWLVYLRDEFIDPGRITNRNKLLEGEVIHVLLSFIGNLSDKAAKDSLAKALKRARSLYPLFDNFKQIEEQLKNLLEAAELKKFFYLEEADVFNEKELVDRYGLTKRIDRMIIKKNEVWVIDFKSSKENQQDSYLQMQEYISLVKELYPARGVQGFILYLDDLTAQKIDG